MPVARKTKKRAGSPKTKRKITARRPRQTRNSPTAAIALEMVRVDGNPIREKIKKEYEQTQRKLEKARGDLDRFHKEDAPRFAQWLNRQFGALLTTLRESGRKLAEAEQLVFEIENEVFFTGISYGMAYRRVMERRQRPDPGQARDDSAGKDSTAEDPDDFDFDPFEMFEELFGEETDDSAKGRDPSNGRGRERGRGHRPGGRRSSGAGTSRGHAAKRSRLKELYRTLVRMLHPDSARDLTDLQREVWHQVQAAYEAGDEEQLEVILALQQVEDKGHTDSTSLSLLQKIILRFKSALKEVQAQLRKLRKDPAWKFSDRKDLEPLKRRFRGQLEDDAYRVQCALEHYESLLEEWKEAAARTRRGGRSRRRRVRDPFGDDLKF